MSAGWAMARTDGLAHADAGRCVLLVVFQAGLPYVHSGCKMSVIPVCSVARRSRANRQPASGHHNRRSLPLPLGIACVTVDVLESIPLHQICMLQPLTCSVLVLGTPPGGDGRPYAASVSLKGMHGLCVINKAHTFRLPPYWHPTQVQALPRGSRIRPGQLQRAKPVVTTEALHADLHSQHK